MLSETLHLTAKCFQSVQILNVSGPILQFSLGLELILNLSDLVGKKVSRLSFMGGWQWFLNQYQSYNLFVLAWVVRLLPCLPPAMFEMVLCAVEQGFLKNIFIVYFDFQYLSWSLLLKMSLLKLVYFFYISSLELLTSWHGLIKIHVWISKVIFTSSLLSFLNEEGFLML